MAETAKFNSRNPAVKRILQEIKEIQREDSPDIAAEALEDNIFEWHFAIRGPPGTEFEGGIYHGRLLMPPDYPFKPPSFMLLTPNGRFETGTKICLSISSHHPEHWQPSWSVRTALTALIAFLPSPAAGAIGSLDFPKEERRKLAAKSRLDPPVFGGPERQEVTLAVHKRMLEVESRLVASISDVALPPAEGAATSTPAAPEPRHGTRSVAEPEAVREQFSSAAEEAAAPEVAVARAEGSDWEDRGLGFLAAALSIAIAAILGRRLLIVAGVDISNFF